MMSSLKPRVSREIGQRLLLSVLLLGMFGEWLYPLHRYLNGEQTNVVAMFLILTSILLLLGCLRLPSFVYTPIPPILVVCSLYYLYGRNEGSSWVTEYISLLRDDVTEIINSGRLYGISGETRALLLLIGWTLLVVSVQMLALGRQSIALFIFATMLYLLSLEMFGEIDVFPGLVRAAGWGLALQALAFRSRLGLTGTQYRFTSIAAVMATGCVLGALFISTWLPVQPDRHIPWSKVAAAFEAWGGAEMSGRQSNDEDYSISGYSKDDSRLGGPLRLRYETAFTAVSSQRTYWRGESKNVYTGQGWSNLSNTLAAVEASAMLEVGQSREQAAIGDITRGSSIKQTVMFKRPMTEGFPLFSGGNPIEVGHIYAEEPEPGVDVESGKLTAKLDPRTDALYVHRAFHGQEIYGYELTVDVPVQSAKRLKQVQGADPEPIVRQDLQLPASVSQRVRDLGVSLTEGKDNRYDAVTAVIDHLKKNYVYSLDTVAPPEGGELVDHFLFQQKKGYCDHFSTAMTVLLRSGGIPARWVKGFAPGTPDSEDQNRYTISYADAHAWVEVYFPEVGWIPFDPTPGYDSMFASGLTESEGASRIGKGTEFIHRLKQIALASLIEARNLIIKSWMMIQTNMLLWTSIVLAAGFIIMVTTMYRKVWLRQCSYMVWRFALRRSRKFPENNTLLQAADRVWQELFSVHGPRGAGSTAREYMNLIHAKHGGRNDELENFFEIWETLYYGNATLDRSRSKKFLELCRGLAFSRR